jgi:YVTN family beta-propeller protein
LISISPASGTTPVTVHVAVDAQTFADQRGTVTAFLHIASPPAVNLAADVRVLINNRAPEQRGTIVDVPDALVDVLADPGRGRFYVLRQDKNQVLVFDATTNQQIATLRTGNTPTQMAITFDQGTLLVGHENSET